MSCDDISVFPLAIPIISTLALVWFVMRSSTWIIRRMGRTSILVLLRIFGIILAALAVQFVLNGFILFAHNNGFLK